MKLKSRCLCLFTIMVSHVLPAAVSTAKPKDEKTSKVSLPVELLDQDYNAVGAFTSASLLAGIALLTLLVKSMIEWRQARQQATPALQTDSH